MTNNSLHIFTISSFHYTQYFLLVLHPCFKMMVGLPFRRAMILLIYNLLNHIEQKCKKYEGQQLNGLLQILLLVPTCLFSCSIKVK